MQSRCPSCETKCILLPWAAAVLFDIKNATGSGRDGRGTLSGWKIRGNLSFAKNHDWTSPLQRTLQPNVLLCKTHPASSQPGGDTNHWITYIKGKPEPKIDHHNRGLAILLLLPLLPAPPSQDAQTHPSRSFVWVWHQALCEQNGWLALDPLWWRHQPLTWLKKMKIQLHKYDYMTTRPTPSLAEEPFSSTSGKNCLIFLICLWCIETGFDFYVLLYNMVHGVCSSKLNCPTLIAI